MTYSPVSSSNCITTDAVNVLNKKKKRMEKIQQLRARENSLGPSSPGLESGI